jgi:hypothetical protein
MPSLRKTRAKPRRKNNEVKSKAPSIRFSVVDRSIMAKIERLSEKHNYTYSFTAQLIMSIAMKHCPQLIEHFLEHADEISTSKITSKRINPFTFKGKVYTFTEIKIAAHLLNHIRLDSVGWNLLNIWNSFPKPTAFTLSEFQHVVPKLHERGIIVSHAYGGRWARSFTLHKDCLSLVNQAIDEGYLNEL